MTFLFLKKIHFYLHVCMRGTRVCGGQKKCLLDLDGVRGTHTPTHMWTLCHIVNNLFKNLQR